MRLSVVIPVFNEESTILEIVDRVRRVNLPGITTELVIVDDAFRYACALPSEAISAFKTTDQAPRGRIIAIDTRQPARDTRSNHGAQKAYDSCNRLFHG